MSIEEQKQALVKKRSTLLRLFLISIGLGIVAFGFGSFQNVALFKNIGALFSFLSLVFIVMAYKTGQKYINL